MKTFDFQFATELPASPVEVFAYIANVRNVEKAMPEWMAAKVVFQSSDPLALGTEFKVQMGFWPFKTMISSKVIAFEADKMFTDIQFSGPFGCFEHRHIVKPAPAGAIMEDHLKIALKGGFAGYLAMLLAGQFIFRFIFWLRKRQIVNYFKVI